MANRILIITLGNSPQIVTETIYALARTRTPWIADHLVITTTAEGEEACRTKLLAKDGALERLYEVLQLELPKIRFLVPERLGRAIEDVSSADETIEFAEVILPEIRLMTQKMDNQIHLSIAGGRKTMGIVANNLMQLFGRGAPHDMISHSLIDSRSCPRGADLENDPDFWWPGCSDDPAHQNARIVLHDLPYPQLRSLLDEEVLFGSDTISYRSLIARTNMTISPRLVVDFRSSRLVVGGLSVRLPSAEFSALAVVVIACLFDQPIKVPVKGHFKMYALGDRADAFKYAWATARTLVDLSSLRIQPDTELGQVRSEFDLARAERLTETDWDAENAAVDLIDRQLSRAKNKFRKVFVPRIAERVLVSKMGVKATDFSQNEIEVLLPDGFSIRDFVIPD